MSLSRVCLYHNVLRVRELTRLERSIAPSSAVGADGKLNLLLQERYFCVENSVFSTDASTGPFSEISRDAYDAASPKRPHLYIKVQELAFTSGPNVTSNTL